MSAAQRQSDRPQSAPTKQRRCDTVSEREQRVTEMVERAELENSRQRPPADDDSTPES